MKNKIEKNMGVLIFSYESPNNFLTLEIYSKSHSAEYDLTENINKK